MFGINIHRASKWGIVNYINKFSAGCQVFKDPEDFEELIGMCEKALKSFHNNFSYTLLEEGVLPIINLNSPSYQLKKMDGDLEASKKNDLF